MNKKYPWLPVDERLIPDIFSFKYSKSFWIRTALFMEMFCAVIAVFGTLILTILPRPPQISTQTQAITTQNPTTSPTSIPATR